MTLQETLHYLDFLARDRGAEITTTIDLSCGGAHLTVFWESDLPREAHLFFGPQFAWDESTVGTPDAFEWAWVIDPHRFMAATEEGLDDDRAGDEARRIVASIEDVTHYLLGRPYQWVKKTVDSRA